MALISLDAEVQSFVDVRRTLTLEEKESEYLGQDTVWYSEDYWYIDNIYRSNYDIKDAQVIVSDGKTDYPFVYQMNQNNYWYSTVAGQYVDTTGSFTPKPNTDYFLTVKAMNGKVLTGSVTTPSLPGIHSESVPDTVYAKKPYSISYDLGGDVYGEIATYLDSSSKKWICGADINSIVRPGSNKWKTPPNDCGEFDWGENTDPGNLIIRLRVMDDQYYEYMYRIKGNDFVDFLTGGGSRGHAIGVEGGIGVFGAIATDKIKRVIVP